MKEYPILFSTDMVQAILADRKTQTRRIIKDLVCSPSLIECGVGKRAKYYASESHFKKGGPIDFQPYGQPGDRLWVRETWLPAAWDATTGRIKVLYKADMRKSNWITPYPNDPTGEKFNHLWLGICDELDRKGIQPDSEGNYHFQGTEMPLSWRPSIHMPRTASRILLENELIRAERVQDISEEDAVAEGIEHDDLGEMWRDYTMGENDPERCLLIEPSKSFQSLWQSINGPESWNANPWVWAITFKRISQ
jgi:hypothetical protein